MSEKVVEDWVRHEDLPHIVDRDRFLFHGEEVAGWARARGLSAKAGFLAEEAAPLRDSIGLDPLLRAGGIWRDVAAKDARAALATVVSEMPGVDEPVCQLLAQRIQSPGGLVWAPVGRGFALPHLSARVALGRDAGVIALVLLRDPLPLEDPPPDGEPVTRLVFFIAPTPREHLDLLARLARLVRGDALRSALREAADDESVFRTVAAAEAAAAGAPAARPADPEPAAG